MTDMKRAIASTPMRAKMYAKAIMGLDLAKGESWTPCPRRQCDGKLKASKAIAQTFTSGEKD